MTAPIDVRRLRDLSKMDADDCSFGDAYVAVRALGPLLSLYETALRWEAGEAGDEELRAAVRGGRGG